MRVCSRCLALADRQPDDPVLHLGRMRMRAALVRGDRLAAFQLNDEIMQRTGHAPVVHNALRQRPALVRAAVVEREHLVILGAEHRDVAACRAYHARAEARNVLQRADFGPVAHATSISASSAIGLNSLLSTPRRARAAHGSLCANCCEWAKRSYSALRLARS